MAGKLLPLIWEAKIVTQNLTLKKETSAYTNPYVKKRWFMPRLRGKHRDVDQNWALIKFISEHKQAILNVSMPLKNEGFPVLWAL